ncbi:unnamed protein product [Protopolystoma xenopodis]|uniref:Uncharacterized protein n=1 Tax=Protopolystoma xenopodis TaxID=117903 RepID=A0A3S5A9Z2_9PLAT|nr:unnamed protein product [Protopolystoma xenopodis]
MATLFGASRPDLSAEQIQQCIGELDASRMNSAATFTSTANIHSPPTESRT